MVARSVASVAFMPLRLIWSEEILSLRKEFAEDIGNINDYERLEAIADTNIPPPAFEEFVAAESEKAGRVEGKRVYQQNRRDGRPARRVGLLDEEAW